MVFIYRLDNDEKIFYLIMEDVWFFIQKIYHEQLQMIELYHNALYFRCMFGYFK